LASASAPPRSSTSYRFAACLENRQVGSLTVTNGSPCDLRALEGAPARLRAAPHAAGARRPAPAAEPPRTPDPRPGRRRVRFSFLPALALLLSALSPFAAASVSAAVLISNIDQTRAPGTGSISGIQAYASGFNTGSHAAGYSLSSIEAVLVVGTPTPAHIARFKAELWSATVANTGPSAMLSALEIPSSFPTGTATFTFTAPPDVVLEASKRYFLVLYGTGFTRIAGAQTQSDNEDDGAAPGWTIPTFGYQSFNSRRAPTGTWHSNDNKVPIRVNGSAVQGAAPHKR